MTASRRTRNGRPSTRCSGPPRVVVGGRGRPYRRGPALGAWAGATARERRDLLLPGLHAVNDRVGWISEGALDYLCRRLTVPPAEAYGVATFYSMFSVKPRPATVVHVCTDLACAAAPRRGRAAARSVERRLGPCGQAPAARSGAEPCLGLCERAPAALAIRAASPVGRRAWLPAPLGPGLRRGATAPRSGDRFGRPRAIEAGGDRTPPPSSPPPPPRPPCSRPRAPELGTRGATRGGWPSRRRASGLMLLRRVGVVDPASLDDYRAHGGYAALRPAFALGPAGVIREVTDSGLVGRGGAAFPTGRKWQATAAQPDHPHYLVCNADESEPGTFKDRVLMEGDPYALIEAMTIAGYATGAHQGYLYLRGEYPRALRAPGARHRAGPRPRPARRRRPRPGLRLRHRDPARRGRVHLRRGDRALQLHRGLPRRAALASRPSPWRRACSASRPPSTTSRRWSTCCRS